MVTLFLKDWAEATEIRSIGDSRSHGIEDGERQLARGRRQRSVESLATCGTAFLATPATNTMTLNLHEMLFLSAPPDPLRYQARIQAGDSRQKSNLMGLSPGFELAQLELLGAVGKAALGVGALAGALKVGAELQCNSLGSLAPSLLGCLRNPHRHLPILH